MPDDVRVTVKPDAADLPALLAHSLRRHADRPALSFQGRRWTYAELGRLVARATRGLQAHGVVPGTRVGLCLPNTPYSVVFYFAALQAGATVVNFNPLYVERELVHQITDSGTEIMVVPDVKLILDRVAAAAGKTGLRRIVVCPIAGVLPRLKGLLYPLVKRREIARMPDDPRFVRYAALTADRAPPAPVAIDAAQGIAVLQYTGGTTGVPKGAMLTHAALVANARQVVAHMPSIRDGQERMLAVLPLFHVFAMTAVMNAAIAIGAEIILQPRYVLADVIRAIETERPTLFHAVPTIYAALGQAAEAKRHDLSSLRVCISGGAPLPADVRERFVRATGCKLVEGYGLSEASPVICCNPPDGIVKDGSVGVPVRDTVIEIRALDDPHRVLPPGERGEICVRGPQVMDGYWGRPDDTEAVFVDGALRTGDVGMLDEDGYLFILDRLKEVILCSGYNVYPRVLEEALYAHPAVAEAVVIGVPDAYRGQAPRAYVTLRDGQSATPDELRAFLADYVSKIEMPQSVVIRDSLPKTMIGKLSKKELIAEAMAEHAAHG